MPLKDLGQMAPHFAVMKSDKHYNENNNAWMCKSLRYFGFAAEFYASILATPSCAKPRG